MRAAIFGIGNNYFNNFKRISESYEIVSLIDNSELKQGQVINGLKVCPITQLKETYYDVIIVTPSEFCDIVEELLNHGIRRQCIRVLFCNVKNSLVETYDYYSKMSRELKKFQISSEQIVAYYHTLTSNLPLNEEVKIINCDNCSWNVIVDDISILLKCKGDVFTFEEIFILKEYNLVTNRDSLIIDIGMNIGIASLFFAKNRWVKKIYGYEPFPITYESAISNIQMNSQLAKKIYTFNFGLSDKNEKKFLPYMYDMNRGLSTLGRESIENGSEIYLRCAGEEIKIVMEKDPMLDVILKIDCEGSEYAIIDQLDKMGILKSINYIIMEWHTKPNIEGITFDRVLWVIELLSKTNFKFIQSFRNGTKSFGSGFIYAINGSII